MSNDIERKLKRVEHLINLAADKGASEEEARTSAIMAIRIIKEQGFNIVLPQIYSKPQPSYQRPKPKPKSKPKPQSKKRFVTDYFKDIPASSEWTKAFAFIRRYEQLLRDGKFGSIYSVRWMITVAVSADVIKYYERHSFEQKLRQALQHSNLKSKRGRKGGYYL